MTRNWQISRRAMLRGMGTALALPLLEGMMPHKAFAAAASTAAPAAPLRSAFIFVPNGVQLSHWTPTADGANFELPRILQPLAPVKDKLTVFTGLDHVKAKSNGDGAGDHARSAATFLTGQQARKTSGADIRIGVSIDQMIARQVGDQTRLPSLELGCDKPMTAGACDSGYSCAYSANISWTNESMPMLKLIDPKTVFERLFGSGQANEQGEARFRRDAYRKSILDFVRSDAASLKNKLGMNDQRKLDEYLHGVRAIEQRIDRAFRFNIKAPTDFEVPDGVPADYAEHIRLMGDLMVLAFQADVTRVATLMIANEGSNRPYPDINVRDGHHDLSHHGGDEEKQEKITKINEFHMQQFAYFIKRLDEIKEGDATLLDNSMIIYGSGIGDGNRHTHEDLPVLMLGRGGGTIKAGRHLRYDSHTPMCNLYLAMLERYGAKADSFGDSTGVLQGLA